MSQHAPTEGQHIPGPCSCGVRDVSLEIGRKYEIVWCPLHATAPAMLQALESITRRNVALRPEAEFETPDDWIIITASAFEQAHAALAQARGKGA